MALNYRVGQKSKPQSVNIWRRYGQKFAAYFFGPPRIGDNCTV